MVFILIDFEYWRSIQSAYISIIINKKYIEMNGAQRNRGTIPFVLNNYPINFLNNLMDGRLPLDASNRWTFGPIFSKSNFKQTYSYFPNSSIKSIVISHTIKREA